MKIYIISAGSKMTDFEFTVLADNADEAISIVKKEFPHLHGHFIEEEHEMLSRQGIIHYSTESFIGF